MRPAVFTAMFLSAVSLPFAAQTTTAVAPNTISVCVGNFTGLLREVSASRDCLKGIETFQQFNISGPQGLQGPAGAAGAKGATGSQGPIGLTGSTGATGAQGPAGSTGAAGATGAVGPQGASGAPGAAGGIGPQGPIGATGPAGAQGPSGPAGSTGAAGSGFNYRGSYSSAATYNAGDVVLYNGALYLDASTAGVSGLRPDTPGGPYGVFLPQGAAGATGAKGMVGATGAQGPQGPVGATGAAGANGTNGTNGVNGTNGANGAAGAGYGGTSNTGVILGTGSKNFQTQAGLAYIVGSRVRAVPNSGYATPGDFVEGTVTAYSGVALTLNVDTDSATDHGVVFSNWSFSIAGLVGAPGATGPQGSQGATGTAGPSGPTGPQGPTGTGPQYYVYFYTQTQNLIGVGTVGAAAGEVDGNSYTVSCPANEIAVSGSCGYQAPSETPDQADIKVNYAGIDNYAANSAQCSVSNTSASSRNITVGVSCLTTSAVPFGASASVVKSCTYDPATQAPCTAADAVAATETSTGRFKAAETRLGSPGAEPIANAAASSVQADGTGKPKAKTSVTLWFRE